MQTAGNSEGFVSSNLTTTVVPAAHSSTATDIMIKNKFQDVHFIVYVVIRKIIFLLGVLSVCQAIISACLLRFFVMVGEEDLFWCGCDSAPPPD